MKDEYNLFEIKKNKRWIKYEFEDVISNPLSRMSAFREETHALLSNGTKGWAEYVGVDEPTLKRLLFNQDSVNLKVAQKIVDGANRRLNTKWTVETFFHPEKIRWYETERIVTYEYGVGRPVSDNEWIGYFRYIYEKRVRGHGIFIALIFLLIIGLISIVIWYFMK